MRRLSLSTVIALSLGSHLSAQSAPAAPPAIIPPAAQQIAAAVLPAPKEFRESATVMGYDAAGKFVTLREGKGPFICLASDPHGKGFHVSCYHRSLEPFMARGRALRASGVTGEKVDTARFAEIMQGKLAMPKQAAALYQLFGKPDVFDPATGTATGAQALFVIYISGATAESTGLSAQPVKGGPWIMFPGTPKAHIMLTPAM